ncbi:FmdB family zinc ribbon protein [Jatrophihabitans sp. YIM 134969]
MPLHDFRCASGHRFEHHIPITGGEAPLCACGAASTKLVSAGALLGRADAGLSQDRMPQTWKGTYNGNSEYIAGLRRQWSDRQRLEAKYPEIAGDRRPVLAHEGRYHDAPLRAGDVDLGSHGHAHGHSHDHDHGAGHTHPHPHPPAAPASTPAPVAPATPAARPTGGA